MGNQTDDERPRSTSPDRAGGRIVIAGAAAIVAMMMGAMSGAQSGK
jgi:hypothetical protein